MKLKLTIVLSITALAVFLMTANHTSNSSSANLRRLQELNVSNSSLPASFKINGLSNLIQALNDVNTSSNSSFDTLTVDNISQSATDQGILYQAIVTLTNDQGDAVNSLLNGLYDSVSNSVVFNASEYSPPSENSSNSSAPAGPVVTSDGYTIIDVAQAQNDSDTVAAFNWGEQTILNSAQQNRKIPPSTYNVSQWVSAAYKNWTNGITYSFAALAQGENGVNVETKFNVTYNNRSNSYRLKDFYYRGTNITLDQLAALNATNTTNNAANETVAVNSTSNGTAPDNATVTVADNSTTFVGVGDNSTDSANNVTLVVDNSTVINASNPAIIPDTSNAPSNASSSGNASNSSAPVVNTTNNTISIPVGYTALDNTTIAQNQQAYNALLFGSQAVVSKAINQYKLPSGSPNYTITSVGSAIYKNQSNGVWYVFAADLQNALNYKVNANFTVFYRNANQSYSLNGYGYYTSNYRPNAIIRPASNSNVISNVSAIISNATVSDTNTALLSIAPVNSSAALNSTVADAGSATPNPPAGGR